MADDLELATPELNTEPIEQEQPEHEEAPDHEGESAAEPVESKEDLRKLPADIKRLKDTDPAAYKAAKGQFFSRQALEDKLKDFDLDGVKTWLGEKGGKEAYEAEFASASEKAKEYDALSQLLVDGKPEFASAMAQVSGDNFPKVAVATLNEWSKSDPDGYKNALYGAFNQTISASNIPFEMEKANLYVETLAGILGNIKDGFGNSIVADPQLRAAWERMVGQIGVFDKFTKQFGQPVQPSQARPNQPNKQLDEREQRVTQAEKAQKDKQYKDAYTGDRTTAMNTLLGQYDKGKTPDAEARAIATDLLTSKLDSAIANDAPLQKTLNEMLARGDTAGAAKLRTNREAMLLKSEDFQKVARKILSGTGTPAPKNPAAARPPAAMRMNPVPRDPAGDILRRAMER